MSRRATIGDNPLDLVVPKAAGPATGQAMPKRSESEPESAPGPSSPAQETLGVGALQCLTFFISGTEYAVTILHVKEIIEFRSLTPVPATPAWIRGVMNLRGTVVPVLDVAVKFGLKATEVTKRTCIVIMEVVLAEEKTVMGVMTDAVSRVVDWNAEDVEPTPAFGTDVDVDCVLGMGKLEDQLVPILDIDRILATRELDSVGVLPPAGAGVEAAGDASLAK